MVQSFISANKNSEKNSLKEEKRLLKLIYFLEGVADVSGYSKSLASLQKQQGYLAAKKKEQEDFELETRVKQNYIQCIDLKDLLWWRQEVLNFRKAGSNAMNDSVMKGAESAEPSDLASASSRAYSAATR